MSLRSNDRQWGSVAKFFHWVIALGILGNGLFGLLMDLAHSPMQKINWLALHKSIGLTVLALVLLRIAWRWADRRPPDEPMPRWQRRSTSPRRSSAASWRGRPFARCIMPAASASCS